jgi:hypothetical protein
MNTYGIQKTIDKTIYADVYVDSDFLADATSAITISGKLTRTLFATKYVGTFAIEYLEPSCQAGVEATIEWTNSGYPDITFYNAGNVLDLGIQLMDVNKELQSMMIILDDGTIITELYYVPTRIWKQYKG